MDTVLIQPNLFVGATELKSLQEKPKVEINNLITNLVNTYGLVKKDTDTAFTNFKVVVGSNPSYIKILAGRALNKNGKNIILGADLENFYQIPDNSQNYYVYVEASDTQFEVGTVSISDTGQMTGIGTDFTKFRVGDYPTRLLFDSLSYGSFYVEVATVTSATEAQLIGSVFPVVTGINYKILGTYSTDTETSSPLYIYDSYNIVVSQTDFNPTPVSDGLRFKLARVENTGGVLTIYDQRFEFLALDNYLTGKKFGAFIDSLDERNDILDADLFLIKSSESNTAMSSTGTKVKSWLKTYFDTLYTGFILTKAAIEAELTGMISSHYHIVSKTAVGLSDVDNTSDLAKPISTATQTALDGKQSAGTYATGTGSANGTNTGDNATNSQYSGLATSKQDTITPTTTLYSLSYASTWTTSLHVSLFGKLVIVDGVFTGSGSSVANTPYTLKTDMPTPLSATGVYFSSTCSSLDTQQESAHGTITGGTGDLIFSIGKPGADYMFNFSYISE